MTAKSFPVVSLIVCLIAVLILCALGVWQIERLQWKNNLQQNLDAAFSAENPVPFTAEQINHLQKGQVLRGVASGKLNLPKSIIVQGRIEDGKSIVAIVAPFTMDDHHVKLPVEVGCTTLAEAQKLTSGKTKSVTIKGVLREPRWSFATPQNNPDKHEWWRIDRHQLAPFWMMPNLKHAVITAENTNEIIPSLSPSLTPCPIEKTLRNDHLSYAFFWFSMAGVLSIIWALRFLRPYLQSA